jgi:pimeloyl-ACP methyl ester carboxylesterase
MEALVLAPGLVCDASVWQQQVDDLGSYRAIQVADHGLCDDLGAMADNLLARAPAKFALAGHSMGGRVALEVYARAPQRVTHLALLFFSAAKVPEAAKTVSAGTVRYGSLRHSLCTSGSNVRSRAHEQQPPR